MFVQLRKQSTLQCLGSILLFDQKHLQLRKTMKEIEDKLLAKR